MSKETLTDVLIVGGGGREHAFGWKLRKSPNVRHLYFAPGNAGTEKLGRNLDIGATDIDKLARFAADNKVLTIVGPERPLANGIRNQFDKDGLKLVGFTQESTLLESSKAWANGFVEHHNIPHPSTKVFRKVGDALQFFESVNPQNFVIKTDGLWDGKGVVLPKSVDEATRTVMDMMVGDVYGEAGRIIVVQEKLVGREVSVIGITDGKTIRYFAPAVDHKTLFDRTQNERKQNPNTGGMGAYAPDPLMTPKLFKEIHETIMQRAIDGMREEGYPLNGGILFAGLMITEDGPKVLEFNVRGGDPETQVQSMVMKNDLLPVVNASLDGTLFRRSMTQRKGAAVGVYLVSEGYPGKLVIGRVVNGSENDFGPDVEFFHAGTARDKVTGEIKTSSGRVLCVTAYGQNVPNASDKTYSIINRGDVNFERAIHRQGIGAGK
ncbi:MAG: phosphoribosylamine--glycine ligase [Candidatus Levybacteria bacterium RIFCSPHIGHO2_02_FULL_37_13]|nr:MAG: phosphoribosylamine--glycine ligase [Candidatus Levybacteria bacterium RIFCSPHIGHO2_02_FULL_37_13]OGH30469.1 MAG: phosphoribosylamine--glycine ligase [Candidatus Levybacteria bacterium RIFCSPHIGHO2_12_FULL_37_9]OGH37568.1 MAG: phosphoribosylamine--glycine ligase [Candidatus Levybacteria bacterium RIFCSPLOWO2_01_FULL_37_26]